MIQAIADRRSIRKYTSEKISPSMIDEIIQAGIMAPSSKNRQPWKFIVVEGKAKEEAAAVMRKGIEREKRDPLLPGSAVHLRAAEHTVSIMEQAPVVIFVVNTLGIHINNRLTPEERIYEICNAQSIGAAVENMILTATELGLGSLWICDTYFAYKELNEWLDADGELIAAVAVGYAAEAPAARPRKRAEDVVEWRSQSRCEL